MHAIIVSTNDLYYKNWNGRNACCVDRVKFKGSPREKDFILPYCYLATASRVGNL